MFNTSTLSDREVLGEQSQFARRCWDQFGTLLEGAVDLKNRFGGAARQERALQGHARSQVCWKKHRSGSVVDEGGVYMALLDLVGVSMCLQWLLFEYRKGGVP